MKKTSLVISVVIVLAMVCSCFLACEKHIHQFDRTTWAYDTENHWRVAVCEHKEEISDKAAHVFRANGKCQYCDYIQGSAIEEDEILPTKEFSQELSREVSVPSSATVTENGVNYVLLANNTYEVAGFASSSMINALVIPETVNGLTVSSIAPQAFMENTAIQTVTLNDKITKIGQGAFADCTNLTSITGLASLKTLGGYVFQSCSKLASIELPEGLKVIDIMDFYGCSALTAIEIPNTVERIGQTAFYKCSRLESVEIPSSVKILGNAFADCTSLTEVVIPDTVQEISFAAMFYNCINLEKITVPFLGLNRDEGYSLGYLFDGGFDLDNYVPQSSNTTVPSSLKSVTVTDCTHLPDFAFYGCAYLEEVIVSDTVTHVGDSAFVGCTKLNYSVDRTGNYIGNEANPYLILAGVTDKTITSFTFSANARHVAGGAFKDCTQLASITFHDNVESVGTNAFENCSSLSYNTRNSVRYLGNTENRFLILVRNNSTSSTFNFEKGTKVIAGGAFKNCSTITNLTIPSDITNIGSYTFYGCAKLATLVIPDTVKSIGAYALTGCSQLTNLTAPAYALVSTDKKNPYDSTTKSLPIKTLNITSGTNIPYGAFYGCKSLEKVTLPDTLEYIYGYAFFECTALKKIDLPDSIVQIDEEAFRGCENLTMFKMPDNLKQLGQNAFYLCSKLEGQLILPEGLEYIGEAAFEQTKISSVYIGASLEYFGARTFGACTLLENVMVSADNDYYYSVGNCIIEIGTGILRVGTNSSVLPEGEYVTAIGDTAFYGRISLTTINIPKSVKSFGENSFYSCAAIAEINYEGTQAEWAAIQKASTWNTEAATANTDRKYIVHCSDGDVEEQGKTSVNLD